MPCKKKQVDFEKNLVQQLNEFYPGLEFEFASEGPVHQPNFMTRTTVDGQEFTGYGNSKAKAKQDVAAKVLSLVAIKDITKGFDSYSITKDLFKNSKPVSNKLSGSQVPTQLSANLPPIDHDKARVSPVMVLSELFPEMTTEWIDGERKGRRHFRVNAVIRGWRFFGEGRSKKIAKTNLAQTVLLCMYNVQDFVMEEDSVLDSKQIKEVRVVPLEKKFPLTQLKELCGEIQYNIQQVTGDENSFPEEKIFSCVAMIKGRKYSGSGQNKKLAKLACAKQALAVLRPKKQPEASA